MSKLGCVCGYTIRDQTDNLPYKGLILRNKILYSEIDAVASEIADFMQADREGKRYEWLVNHFNGAYAELQLDNASIISDLWCRLMIVNYGLDIYQCENCGRVHIEGKDNHFHSFKPDQNGSQNVLDVESIT